MLRHLPAFDDTPEADHDWESFFARVGKDLGEYDDGGSLLIEDRDLRSLIFAARRGALEASRRADDDGNGMNTP
jgi:hypothetical protein